MALGSHIKQVQECERIHHLRGRRSLFVVKDVKKGDFFSRENLAVLRPGAGIPPLMYEEVLGKKVVRDIKAVVLLQEGDWCLKSSFTLRQDQTNGAPGI